MTKITINNIVYHVHPKYKSHASSEDGNVINIVEREISTGKKYLKSCELGQFVWECFNGIIPEGKVVDYINGNLDDNRLCNLKLISSDKSEDESEDESENESENESEHESEKLRNHLQYKKNKQERELRIIKSEIKRLKRENVITLLEIEMIKDMDMKKNLRLFY